MFGPLKFIFYLFVLAGLAYGALYILPSFISVEQVETTQNITLPAPELIDKPTQDAADE